MKRYQDALEDGLNGMQAASVHADAVTPAWTDRATECVIDFARNAGRPFLAEEVVEAAATRLPPPPDGRAWGAALRSAARQGFIVKAGYAPAKTSNLSPKTLWQFKGGA